MSEFKETEYSNVFVNDQGVVINTKPFRSAPGPLKIFLDKDGYQIVQVYPNHKLKLVKVHRLVAKAFVPGYQDGLTVNHKNRIKTDNRAENLEWVSLSDNVRHSYLNPHRKKVCGDKISWSIIKDIDAAHIRLWRKEGFLQREIGNAYGLSQSDISRIILRKTWKHIA